LRSEQYFTARNRTGRKSNVHRALGTSKELGSIESLVSGIAGLVVLLGIFACVFPIGVKILEDTTNTRPGSVFFMLFIQTVVLPPIISFCFATVTPMFWYGSVIVRFGLAMAMCIPGMVVFMIAMILFLDGSPPDDFMLGFITVMFTYFLTVAAVSVTVQLWTPWTLVNQRDSDSQIPPTGMRSMLELTCVAAIGFCLFPLIRHEDATEGIVFFFVCGLLTSLATITMFVALLGDKPRKGWLAVAFFGALGASGLFNGFFAVMEYGWTILTIEAALILFVSLYGVAVCVAVAVLHLWWLRRCGWRCVHRRELKESAELATPRYH